MIKIFKKPYIFNGKVEKIITKSINHKKMPSYHYSFKIINYYSKTNDLF